MKYNHLIIGIGALGGQILGAFLQSLPAVNRPSGARPVPVDCLCLSSGGIDSRLMPEQQVLLSDTEAATALEGPEAFPGITEWFGSSEEWEDLLARSPAETPVPSGRRWGRLLFALNHAAYTQKLGERVQALRPDGDAPVTFHLCCDLGEDLASGCLIDAIAQIRVAYPEPETYRIFLYCALPGRTAGHQTADTLRFASAYAALQELNALSIGALAPYDVTGKNGRLTVAEPFAGCYLLGPENDRGDILATPAEVAGAIADFLQQKIVTVSPADWESLLSGEEDVAPPPTGRQSNRFFAFGIKRLLIPEGGSRQYLYAHLTREAVFGLLDADPSASEVPFEKPSTHDFTHHVNRKDVWHRWYLSDDHLRLSQGILAGERNDPTWKPLQDSWQEVLPAFRAQVQETHAKNPKVWLEELTLLFEKHYRQGFREQGVDFYYRFKKQDRAFYLNEIRARMQSDLLLQWKRGTLSLADIRWLLESLMMTFQYRIDGFEQQAQTVTEQIKQLEKRIEDNKTEFTQLPIFPPPTARRLQLLETHGTLLVELYHLRTSFVSWNFARDFLQSIQFDLMTLETEIARSSPEIIEATRSYIEVPSDLAADSAPLDNRHFALPSANTDGMGEMVASFLNNKEEVARQIPLLRTALLEELGENLTFSGLQQIFQSKRFAPKLEQHCQAWAEQLQSGVSGAPAVSPGFGQNIINRLKQECAERPELLEQYLHDLVLTTGNYVHFHFSKPRHSFSANGASVSPTQPAFRSIVLLPKSGSDPDYYSEVVKTIGELASGPFTFLPEDTAAFTVRPNEITLITVASHFSLHCLQETEDLKQAYDAVFQGTDATLPVWALHSEGDGLQLPAIVNPARFESSLMKARGDSLTFVLLGKALNIVRTDTKAAGVHGKLGFLPEDGHTFGNDPIILGDSLVAAAENLNSVTAGILKSEILRQLRITSGQAPDVQQAIPQAIVSQINEVKVACGHNPEDEQYLRFFAAGRQALTLLRKAG